MTRLTTAICLTVFTCLAAACGAPEPAAEAPAEAPAPDTGAGTIPAGRPPLRRARAGRRPHREARRRLRLHRGARSGTARSRACCSPTCAGTASTSGPRATGRAPFIEPVFEGDRTGLRSVSSNGLTLDADGRLVMCEHGNRLISRVEEDGTRTTLVDSYEGRRLNSPNDAAYASDGWLYFTDPGSGPGGPRRVAAARARLQRHLPPEPGRGAGAACTATSRARTASRCRRTSPCSTSPTPIPSRRSGWPTT